MKHVWRFSIWSCLLLVLLGCGAGTKRDKPTASRDPAGSQDRTAGQDSGTPQTSNDSTDQWQLILFKSRKQRAGEPAGKIGHARLITRKLKEGPRELLKRTLRTELMVNRNGTETPQWMELKTFETSSGQLVRFETIMSMGRGTKVMTGRVDGDKLKIETLVSPGGGVAPRTESSEIDWKSEFRGFFAVDDSLRAKPMKPGEKRIVRYLEPSAVVVNAAELEALGYEQVALLDETVRALHIRQVESIGGSKFESHLWCDEQGESLKGAFIGTGMEQYRTTRQVALGPWKAPQIDFAQAMMIPVREVPNPHETQEIVYLVRLEGKKNAAQHFVHCPSQLVKSNEDGSATITVRRIRPADRLDGPAPRRPTDADSSPNSLIQSDDAQIIALAKSIARGEQDPWKVACALEAHVSKLIRKKNFSQAFATAAEVLQTLEGDCTEHAVLLTALCRARGISSRVAIGLIYFVDPPESRPQMAYHMWSEVFVADRWIPLDGTLGRGGIGAAHLKIADSSLAGASAFSTLLPLMQVANRLELEIKRVQ